MEVHRSSTLELIKQAGHSLRREFGQRALMVLHITMTEMALHGSRVSLLQHLIRMRLQQRLDDELIIGIRCVGAGRLWNMQDRGA